LWLALEANDLLEQDLGEDDYEKNITN